MNDTTRVPEYPALPMKFYRIVNGFATRCGWGPGYRAWGTGRGYGRMTGG